MLQFLDIVNSYMWGKKKKELQDDLEETNTKFGSLSISKTMGKKSGSDQCVNTLNCNRHKNTNDKHIKQNQKTCCLNVKDQKLDNLLNQKHTSR